MPIEVIYMNIALKEIRTRKGLTVADIAKQTGISSGALWSYERGDRNPDIEVACQLADFLDVSLDMLIRGKEKDRPEERSMEGILKQYDKLSPADLRVVIALAEASLHDKLRRGLEDQVLR